MNYLKTNVLGSNEIVMIEPKKNPVSLIFTWIFGILFYWLLFIPTIMAIRATIQYNATEYLITDKRVMEKYGWISTHTDEMPVSKIENVTVSYTFFGKLFNYGTISFQGANDNDINFSRIKDAEIIKRMYNECFD